MRFDQNWSRFDRFHMIQWAQLFDPCVRVGARRNVDILWSVRCPAAPSPGFGLRILYGGFPCLSSFSPLKWPSGGVYLILRHAHGTKTPDESRGWKYSLMYCKDVWHQHQKSKGRERYICHIYKCHSCSLVSLLENWSFSEEEWQSWTALISVSLHFLTHLLLFYAI